MIHNVLLINKCKILSLARKSQHREYRYEDPSESVIKISAITAIPAILDMICRTTGMGFAPVARVTDERWVACAVLDKINFGLPVLIPILSKR
ncbi:hypothetical protein [Mucilaginibacter pineti]|nr:hypothetical protein [Mucilaginibacter pineti]